MNWNLGRKPQCFCCVVSTDNVNVHNLKTPTFKSAMRQLKKMNMLKLTGGSKYVYQIFTIFKLVLHSFYENFLKIVIFHDFQQRREQP